MFVLFWLSSLSFCPFPLFVLFLTVYISMGHIMSQLTPIVQCSMYII